jgi:hypothetical protein
MFHNFTADTSERDWSIICCIVFFTFFVVYINDLSEYMKSSQLRLFADDSIIYKTIKSQKDCDSLQEDLDAAARWESDWLMAFHLYCKVPQCEGPKLSMHTLVLDEQEIGMPATL